MRFRKLLLAVFAVSSGITASGQQATIRVDATSVLHQVNPRYIGVNLEDLNHECYGGLYSQLIHGESFQEHIDPGPIFALTDRQRIRVFVGENERGQLELWGIRGRIWGINAAREALGLPPNAEEARPENALRTTERPIPLEELREDQRRVLLANANPERWVSRQWRSFESGSARGTFGFDRTSPFVGRQSQALTFAGGTGEVGIENAGLNRWGINLVGGRPYEGLLRVKTARAATLWVSLLDSTGSKKLAETKLDVGPAAEYQRIAFTLTPSASDEKGRLGVALRAPGSVTLGYAFLQPGAWGRFKDLPLRKDLAQALIDQGVKVVRYNGSMVNRAPDGHLYKWKEMIGPRDLRKPYRGYFNAYASNGFGIFDFLNFAEAAGFLAVPGLRTDETPQDLQDFLEYTNGPAGSPWGTRRASDGHPAPYGLRHLEIGNEEALDDAYCERFETLAKAIWAKDPGMILLVAHNLRSDPKTWQPGPGGEMSDLLAHAVRLVRFAQQQHGVIWWDHHYNAQAEDYAKGPNPSIAVIETFRQSLRQLVPGYNLVVAPLEENGRIHDMQRALLHARNLNAFFRMGDLPAITVANALQAWQQDLVFDQGETVFTSSKAIPQPSYYVDQTIARNWAPRVVRTVVGGVLDAQARVTEDGGALILDVVNDGNEPVAASLNVTGFPLNAKPAVVTELTGANDAINTPENPGRVRPQTRTWDHGARDGVAQYTFPPRSVTLMRFER
jgi:alpha-L-arabinofuranosidase